MIIGSTFIVLVFVFLAKSDEKKAVKIVERLQNDFGA
jgi:hypothetical protein